MLCDVVGCHRPKYDVNIAGGGQSIMFEGLSPGHGEREPITGVSGQSPQRGPGAEPLVRV